MVPPLSTATTFPLLSTIGLPLAPPVAGTLFWIR